MALSCFVRRASSSIIPLSIRSIGSRIPCQTETSLLNVENRFAVRCGQILPIVRFSTVTNNNIESHNIDDSSKPSFNDFVLEDGPCKGTLTLVRKTQYEIIKIDVRAYQNAVDYYHFDESISEGGENDNQYLIMEQEKPYPDVEDDETMVDVIPCLHLQVSFFYGDMYQRLLKFNVVALTDHPDQIIIRDMSIRVENQEESPRRLDEETSLHLEEFSEFLKKRGVELSNINFLFSYLNSRKVIVG